MFLLRVEVTGTHLLQIIMLLECLELFLHDRRRFHRREDRRDAAVDFE
ncbi:hypothetical protein G6M17_19505 [Agrobacterium tumefaciens]|nr:MULTISPECIES: hypothetical protein [Rhizobium/Agrobacterium group]MCZ7445660.1 hypothetical protein [Rhizobium rhizogenes]NSZ81358.1 hypothetical protein [Agrobacterium tumefaciens]